MESVDMANFSKAKQAAREVGKFCSILEKVG